jgi:hypothetical protein
MPELYGPASHLPIALLIASVDRPKILPSRLVTHRNPPRLSPQLGLHPKWRDHSSYGYILDGAIRAIAFTDDQVYVTGIAENS